MAKRTPRGWWNLRSVERQEMRGKHPIYPGLALSEQQIAAFMAYQPPATVKQPKPQRTLSEAGNLALSIIDKVAVRVANGAGYYYSDYFMQQVCWITKRVIDELKSFRLIERRNGLFVATAVG
jgi:hypothetical protein